MQRNEYRRALIMLRSLLNGYSGHARIEVRTLMGNLNIRAMIPQGAQSVRAALVGKRSALYYAYPLGNLRRDMRGQSGLSVTFDPRDIGGRSLEEYALLALVTINDGVCELALVGNLNGSCENDWSRVRDVVCALYAPQPRPEEPLIQTPYSLQIESAAEEPVQPEEESIPLDFGELAAQQEENAEEELVWDLSEPDTAAENAADEAAFDETPELFRREGWNFVRIALPDGCGYAFAYVGVPECGGEVCIALPAGFTAEPPVGLEDYSWSGGLGNGYWVKCFSTTENA